MRRMQNGVHEMKDYPGAIDGSFVNRHETFRVRRSK